MNEGGDPASDGRNPAESREPTASRAADAEGRMRRETMTVEISTRPEAEVLPRPTVRVASQSEAVPEEAPSVFELKKFSAFYGTFQAIREIDLTVQPNRITALIGPSGSGKS